MYWIIDDIYIHDYNPFNAELITAPEKFGLTTLFIILNVLRDKIFVTFFYVKLSKHDFYALRPAVLNNK